MSILDFELIFGAYIHPIYRTIYPYRIPRIIALCMAAFNVHLIAAQLQPGEVERGDRQSAIPKCDKSHCYYYIK